MKEEISVRQWQKQFKAGFYDSPDIHTQCGAGWYDWFYQDRALAGRLKKIAKVVMGVTNPFILDNFYIWFKNNAQVAGPLYDDVRFEPISGEAVTRIQASFILDHYTLWFENIKCLNRKAVYDCVRFQPLDTGREGLSFRLDFKNPDEPKKWALYTDRYGPAAPEYGCAGAFEMSRYINTMAHELELGVQPDFLLEKQAVATFLQERTGRAYTAVYREGDHLYSCYLDTPRNPMSKRFLAAYTPETLPPDIQGKGMEQIGNVFVFYSGAVDPVLSQRTAQTKRRYKRKEVER